MAMGRAEEDGSVCLNEGPESKRLAAAYDGEHAELRLSSSAGWFEQLI